jgi:hypothetical protein
MSYAQGGALLYHAIRLELPDQWKRTLTEAVTAKQVVRRRVADELKLKPRAGQSPAQAGKERMALDSGYITPMCENIPTLYPTGKWSSKSPTQTQLRADMYRVVVAILAEEWFGAEQYAQDKTLLHNMYELMRAEFYDKNGNERPGRRISAAHHSDHCKGFARSEQDLLDKLEALSTVTVNEDDVDWIRPNTDVTAQNVDPSMGTPFEEGTAWCCSISLFGPTPQDTTDATDELVGVAHQRREARRLLNEAHESVPGLTSLRAAYIRRASHVAEAFWQWWANIKGRQPTKPADNSIQGAMHNAQYEREAIERSGYGALRTGLAWYVQATVVQPAMQRLRTILDERLGGRPCSYNSDAIYYEWDIDDRPENSMQDCLLQMKASLGKYAQAVQFQRDDIDRRLSAEEEDMSSMARMIRRQQQQSYEETQQRRTAAEAERDQRHQAASRRGGW